MQKNILRFPTNEKNAADSRAARRPHRLPERDDPVEKAIMRATRQLVVAHGFATLLEQSIIEYSGIGERAYRRKFKNREALIRHFFRRNDYWLGNLNTGILDTLGLESYLQQTFLNLMHALYDDRVMQRMLIWELDSDNKTTRHVARLRERENRKLIESFENEGRRLGVDVPALTALLVSGIYYTVLHSERSTFCGVDFSTPRGKKRLAGAINFAVKAIFQPSVSPAANGATMLRLLKNGGTQPPF